MTIVNHTLRIKELSTHSGIFEDLAYKATHLPLTPHSMITEQPNPVTSEALKLSIFEHLRGRRFILASSSLNRKEAMQRMVRQIVHV